MSTKAAPFESEPLPNSETLASIEFSSPGRFSIQRTANLAPPTPHASQPAHTLGQPHDGELVNGATNAQTHILAFLQQAKRSITIASYDLIPTLYNTTIIASACQQFLLSSPRAHIRILLHDSSRLVSDGHALLALSRKLSSRMSIKLINTRASEPLGELLIADEIGLLNLSTPQHLQGYVHYNAAPAAKRQALAFARAWEQSLSDLNLRSFLL